MNKVEVSSMYGTMYADTDSIKVEPRGPLTDTGRVRQKVRELLRARDPWEGITDEDIDYTSSYPSIDEILQWVSDKEERKRHGTDGGDM